MQKLCRMMKTGLTERKKYGKINMLLWEVAGAFRHKHKQKEKNKKEMLRVKTEHISFFKDENLRFSPF